MKISILQVIVKFVMRVSVAFIYAFMAWLIVFGIVRAFIASASEEFAVELAFLFSLLAFVGIFFYSEKWEAPAEH